MQVQAERDQRHQQRRDQRDRPAQARATLFAAALGVGEQFAGSLGAAILQLLGGQRAGGLLAGQLGDPLLIKRDVQGGTVFLGLGATATQQRNQQECQGRQQQQAGSEPEIDHLSFFSRLARRACSSADRVVCTLAAVRRRRRTITPITSTPNSSKAPGPNQSSQVRSLTGGL